MLKAHLGSGLAGVSGNSNCSAMCIVSVGYVWVKSLSASRNAWINWLATSGLIAFPKPRSIATLPGSPGASGKNAGSGGMRLIFPSEQGCQMALSQKLDEPPVRAARSSEHSDRIPQSRPCGLGLLASARPTPLAGSVEPPCPAVSVEGSRVTSPVLLDCTNLQGGPRLADLDSHCASGHCCSFVLMAFATHQPRCLLFGAPTPADGRSLAATA